MWASSSCPRTWTRRSWTSAYSPTLALASMMPIRSSTSLMDIWSKVPTLALHHPQLLAWASCPYHATATSWGHYLDRNGTPGRGPPARANSRGPAPAQEYARRGGDPVPRWASCQALQEGEGLQRPHLPPSSQTSWIRLDSPAS